MRITLDHSLLCIYKQTASLDDLPAFSTNSDVQYSLESPGLNISVLLGPCRGELKNPGQVKDFKLDYDPSCFYRGSLIRRTLGLQKLEYTEEDVRSFQHSCLLGFGNIFEARLRHPEDTTRTISDGPLMFISRETGQVLFYPMGTSEIYFSYREYMRRHLEDFLRDWGKKFYGKWDRVS